VSFSVAADAYDRFMGRFSQPLAPLLADLAGVAAGQRVLDVGCGPGALAGELVGRVGPAAVSAVDRSESFVRAAPPFTFTAQAWAARGLAPGRRDR
jgi:trans-aconitate methyltransferase